MNNLNFKDQKLVVDWISFKFQYLEQYKKLDIAKYLCKMGFNSLEQSGHIKKPEPTTISSSKKNKYTVRFIKENSYWIGTLLHFSGGNATHFYNLIKQKKIDWKIFSEGALSRIDLNYSREIINEDKSTIIEFFENLDKKLKQKNRFVIK